MATESMGPDKDRDEQIRLAGEIGDELSEIFVTYARGDLPFEELTFLTYEALASVHAVAIGEYDLVEDDDDDGGYDIEEATDEQEDLAQEPAGGRD
ncbi:MAG TPA: hypothetical protein VGR16_00780 [Thermomicrobiales bacterium]|nr:hypothetical protein [Thermomicrobiales bacterium]